MEKYARVFYGLVFVPIVFVLTLTAPIYLGGLSFVFPGIDPDRVWTPVVYDGKTAEITAKDVVEPGDVLKVNGEPQMAVGQTYFDKEMKRSFTLFYLTKNYEVKTRIYVQLKPARYLYVHRQDFWRAIFG